MISFLYNIAWKCALPFLTKKQRLSIGVKERLGKDLPPPCDIWIHGASAGEVTLIAECIRRISYTQPRDILITTWTKEGKNIGEELQQWALSHAPMITIYVYYFPFDTQNIIARFLNAVRPSLVLIAETEIWYTLFTECKKRAIPLCIINARLSQKTYRYASILRRLFSKCNPDTIIAISEEDKTRFASLFPHSSLTTMHNIKFQSLTIEESVLTDIYPHIVFASIRNKEYPLIAQTILLLQEKINTLKANITNTHQNHTYSLDDIRFYIIPRHLHHINTLIEALETKHISYTVCTTLDEARRAGTQTIIINIFGVSKTIYASAQTVFIGGSLLPEYGGHNFLEPLTYGTLPIVGPYRETFAWAEEGLIEQGLVYPLQESSPHTLADALWQQYIHQADKSNVQKQFSTWVQDKQDGSRAVENLLKQYNLL